jgi:acyl carrier protein
MRNEEITAKINEFLVEEFEVDPSVISPEAPLKETLELDSLDYVDLVVILEGNFGIKVKQEDFTGIRTFQDLYNYVINKSQTTTPPING